MAISKEDNVMMTPAHLAAGYAALSLTKRFWRSENQAPRTVNLLLVGGLLLSIGIDLDVLITAGIKNHHTLLTHYPAFWIIISTTIYSIGNLFGRPFIKSIAIVVVIATLTHLALDIVGVTMGIHLFWPFSMKEISITPLKTDFNSEQERWNYILQSPIMWVGDSIVVMLGLIMYRRGRKLIKRS